MRQVMRRDVARGIPCRCGSQVLTGCRMPRVLAITDTSPGGPGEKPPPVDVAERLGVRAQTANLIPSRLWVLAWIRFPSSTFFSFCLSSYYIFCRCLFLFCEGDVRRERVRARGRPCKYTHNSPALTHRAQLRAACASALATRTGRPLYSVLVQSQSAERCRDISAGAGGFTPRLRTGHMTGQLYSSKCARVRNRVPKAYPPGAQSQ